MKNALKGKIRYIILVLFIALAAVSAVLYGKVGINYDVTAYLDEDTETKISLGIIENEFGMTGNVQVMIRDIDTEGALSFAEKLKKVPNVLTVAFDPSSEQSYKDGNALFNILIDGSDASAEAKQVISDVKALCAEYESVSYGGSAVQSAALRETIGKEMIFILAISLALVAIILLITSSSWIEPIILLLASGIAVVINLGTNVIFGEISYITSAVAAILQLALSIDYSIVLLHSYRAEKEITLDSGEAMVIAVKKVVKPVSASAMTTIAGLVALLFMTFTIGFDIGIVLIKGIVVSAVTALTLLPAVVLIVEKPMLRLKKKEFVPKGSYFCAISQKAGKVVLPIALAAVVLCGVLQSFSTYAFTATAVTDNAIEDTFGKNSTVIVVYRSDSNSVEKERTFTKKLSALDNSPVLNMTSYSGTVMAEYGVDDAVNTLGVKREDAVLLYTMYYLEADRSKVQLTPSELVRYASTLTESNDVKDLIDENTSKALELVVFFMDFMEDHHTAAEVYGILSQFGADISLDDIKSAYDMLGYEGQSLQGRKLVKLASKLTNHLEPEIITALYDLIAADEFLTQMNVYEYPQLTRKINAFIKTVKSIDVDIELPEELIFGVYTKYAVDNGKVDIKPITAKALLEYVKAKAETSMLLSTRLDEEMKAQLDETADLLTSAEEMFIGAAHNRILLTVDIPIESEETSGFVETLSKTAKECFGAEAYIAGEIVSTHDLKTTFDGDNKLITVFTIVSVFVIVMLIFRSLSLPIILVAVIQGAIWIALAVWFAVGEPLFFMSFIMGNCILMGATIDYGILMSSNYVAYRKTLDKKESLLRSVNAALPTVFSSGMIMTVCGFVIGAIATQNAIASVGTMIGIGTLASVVMITVVLPSALYILDGFVMKLSLKNK